MAVKLDGYRNNRYIDNEVKLQNTQPKLIDKTFSQNKTNLSQCIETAPPDRPLREKFCEKGISICRQNRLST